jgi:hypothetical protein
LSGGLFAQEQKTSKDAKKEAVQKKKAKKAAETDSLFRITDSLLTSRKFVLEAQFLKNSKGTRVHVTPDLNFISVDSLAGIIQIGTPQRTGNNGVGGVTEQGRISNWNVTKNDKKKNFFLTMTVQCKFGVYNISVNISYDGYSTATLSGMNKGGTLDFEGNLVSREASSVYKGMHR